MPPVAENYSGRRFGRLVVGERVPASKPKWSCSCDCGGKVVASSGNLSSGSTQSCGCLRTEAHTKHGLATRAGKVPEYNHWCKIKDRINNPANPDYKDYGAKGLTIHPEWSSDFGSFYAHIGPRPGGDGWSVDRLDNSLGYVPGNVRWATATQQSRNRGKQRHNTSGESGVTWLSAGGDMYALARWSELANTRHSKSFSVKTYGLLPAFAMAVAHRRAMIDQLNEAGAGYSVKHGQ